MNAQHPLLLTPCLNALYRSESLEESLADIRANGFSTLECWRLGDMMNRDLPGLLKKYDLHLEAFCPDEFILNDPTHHEAYLHGIERALQNAALLNCPSLITQVGQDNGRPREAQHRAIVDGLRRVAPLLKQAQVTLLIEPLNDVKDHKGYYLIHSQEAFEIVREVESPWVKVLFDVYHQLHTGEDILAIVPENLDLIGHFHIAGFPNRDEKFFDGGYDHRPFLDWAKTAHIPQSVGIECMPTSPQARTELYRTLKAHAAERQSQLFMR